MCITSFPLYKRWLEEKWSSTGTCYVLKILKVWMLDTISLSSDLALQGLGCSFKDSSSMPDPNQMFSISFEREAQDSFPNIGK